MQFNPIGPSSLTGAPAATPSFGRIRQVVTSRPVSRKDLVYFSGAGNRGGSGQERLLQRLSDDWKALFENRLVTPSDTQEAKELTLLLNGGSPDDISDQIDKQVILRAAYSLRVLLDFAFDRPEEAKRIFTPALSAKLNRPDQRKPDNFYDYIPYDIVDDLQSWEELGRGQEFNTMQGVFQLSDHGFGLEDMRERPAEVADMWRKNPLAKPTKQELQAFGPNRRYNTNIVWALKTLWELTQFPEGQEALLKVPGMLDYPKGIQPKN